MPLPKLEAPTFELTVPTTGEVVKFRPFLTGEQKILMIANESEDTNNILNAIKSVLEVTTFNKLDVGALTLADMIYMILQIRCKSIGEIAEFTVTCKHCKDTIPVKLDMGTIEVTINPDHKNKIEISDTVGCILKELTVDVLNSLKMEEEELNKPENLAIVLYELVDNVYDDIQIYTPTKDFTLEEFTEFVDNFPITAQEDIEKFFNTIPQLEKELKYTCPACKKDNKLMLSGISDFFS